MKKNKNGFGILGLIVVLVVMGVVGFVGFAVLDGGKEKMSSTDMPGAFSTYNVDSSDVDFSVEFYDNAELVKNGVNQQIVLTGSDNKKIGVWVKEVKRAASCDRDLKFTYASDYQLAESCYRSDRLIYASTVAKDSKFYFVAITAQKPVNQSDAVKIFSSVELK